MAYIVAAPCIGVKDHACVDVCPVECFYEGEDQLFINPAECVDCDACVSVCPVNAIFAESDVPEQWKDFIEKNASPFRDGVSLPLAYSREAWETLKQEEGSVAHEYYQKYKPAE